MLQEAIFYTIAMDKWDINQVLKNLKEKDASLGDKLTEMVKISNQYELLSKGGCKNVQAIALKILGINPREFDISVGLVESGIRSTKKAEDILPFFSLENKDNVIVPIAITATSNESEYCHRMILYHEEAQYKLYHSFRIEDLKIDIPCQINIIENIDVWLKNLKSFLSSVTWTEDTNRLYWSFVCLDSKDLKLKINSKIQPAINFYEKFASSSDTLSEKAICFIYSLLTSMIIFHRNQIRKRLRRIYHMFKIHEGKDPIKVKDLQLNQNQ
ncbi:hypothetical protein DICPUDRAFT_147834 [Dictyostelium purpureum]|uniref:Uncharacterized protein n=1 Tax=Dictyostelium purpureum TaxID=5786 RepID=F0Z9J0_DICPU|nr:uncharacterized protein DICPUDRAFT_147834 [Dictyostelium purpureum]EGC39392.1 hypothetical protein DICPUDRAFT_147834 [Dictyostelium purpureum]|eukprot:XP_003284066.1 hypothetical protein DICPUDRAFT_147834 [Dictyostelium purpureum]